MKQLYIIGILVAVILILLMGLSKLGQNSSSNDTLPVTDEVTTEVSDESPEELTLPTETEEIMDTATTPSEENTTVIMKTNKGDITIELFTATAPITAGNFLKLSGDDFYDSTKFHRVIDGFMIQGGAPLSKDDAMAGRWGTGGPGYAIADEFAPGLSNVRGTLSMANSGPNTGGSQFFINTVDNLFLDNKHAVFGRVIDGMDVVDAISKVETAPGDRPVEAVVIEDIEL